MSTPTLIATGSTTLVQTGPGNLYGIHVAPVAGGSVVVIDSLTTSNTGADFNSSTQTGIVYRGGVYQASPNPDFLDFKGLHFNTGLTVAASSSARVTVLSGT